MKPLPHISVCVCTYQRPDWLRKLLAALRQQNTKDRFTYSVVLVDNDEAQSTKPAIADFLSDPAMRVTYHAEPRRSIAHARNLTLHHATGDLIAFIDDDEFPDPEWLGNLYSALEQSDAAGVLAPVLPYYGEGTPAWVRHGGFFERPGHESGRVLRYEECRSGNVLFRRAILAGVDPVFSAEFSTGGSDVDFFRRMMAAGHKFIWCAEAPVQEIVPPSRWKRSVLLRRALLRGNNSYRLPVGRPKKFCKAIVAIPLYTVALPFLQLAGHHLFMRYFVKLCDHTGVFLGAFGLTPVRRRPM